MFKNISALMTRFPKVKSGFVNQKFFTRNLVNFQNQYPVVEIASSKSPSVQLTTLENGVRVATYPMDLPTCTVGLYINAGSRYETEENNGVAHFLEHMAFKGTKNMGKTVMEKEVESLGARMFAYTSREHTAYYSNCFVSDAPKILEIISDYVQNPLLEEQAIENERSVILREMEEIETQLDEVVFDYLHGTAYQGSPLGFTILGSAKNVRSLTRQQMAQYIKAHYTGPRTILVATGGVDHQDCVNLAKKYLGGLNPNFFHPEFSSARALPAHYIGSEARIRIDEMPHAHVAVAFEGVPQTHPNFLPLMLASMHVGNYNQANAVGKTHGSRLARTAASDDMCNSFTSFNASYADTALWGVYYVTERLRVHDFFLKIAREWNYIRNNFTDFDTQVAKNSFKSNYMLNLDGTNNIFEELGRQILAYNKYYSPADINSMIDVITTEQVRSAMDELLSKSEPVYASMGPTQGMPAYPVAKMMMFNPVA